ncbi:arylamine N-acetyltransferase (plasmid) [Streptomyces globisporus]|uniref:arylamine N-acetyltransferase family protein n=1 Tax=Streptomyces globisporus TaxID=1908 RepID=UPI002F9189B1|nr:arylamine N-acetyltransferase [Streptomyces globisporus]
MTTPDISALLERIGCARPLRPDAATLRGLYRAWRRQVPYENIDTQLGRHITLEANDLVDKFGHRRRGGQCFEANAAFVLLLRGIGFEAILVDGAAEREIYGDERWGGHNALLVRIQDETWLADVGLADPFLDPLPLRAGRYRSGEFAYALERLEEGVWRAHHHPAALLSSVDFHTTAREASRYVAQANSQRGQLMVHLHKDGYKQALRSRTVRRATHSGDTHIRTLTTIAEFAQTLAEVFGVPLDDLGSSGLHALWDITGEQHARWLSNRAKAH